MNHCFHHRCNMHGVLLLDKPKDVSSNSVLQKVKCIYKAGRAGHTGTLDPLATGILPICFGEATKFARYALNSNKSYRVIAKLGQRTNTSDAYGEIIQERVVLFNKEKLNMVLESFLGNTLQIPPMYSALQYRGKRLYEYARHGIEVPREPRQVTIYKLLCTRYENQEIELEVHCSKGTYVRTIIDDLGEKLGCGAHVTYLRRLTVSNYNVEHAVTLEQLQIVAKQAQEHGIHISELLNSLLIPVESLVSSYPVFNLSSALSVYIKKGGSIKVTNPSLRGLVRITEGEKNKFIGMGEINSEGYVMPRRIVVENLS